MESREINITGANGAPIKTTKGTPPTKKKKTKKKMK